MKTYGLGIDIGGTFTDLVLFDGKTNRQHNHKQLTTPADPTVGVIDGIAYLLRSTGIEPASINRVVHATTLFTNALIERKGAKTGLITTRGFRDVLEIGRERKYELYDLNIQKPQPLVPRHLRLEVNERMAADGSVVQELDEDGLVAAARSLADAGAESVAVVFLHAYVNATHERRANALLQDKFPHLAISCSTDVAPEIREYERCSTTACNAYIKPMAQRYLGVLSDKLRAAGITAELLVMLSNGGFTNVEEAKRNPVQLLESGPAAGALAAAHLGAEDGGLHVLAFDMGGATAKLSVIEDGAPRVAYSFEAARAKRFIEGSGLPLRISTLELIEIGAGGGSIAHTDNLDLLKVGPISAGSSPGPACYGRGGEEATVTDANLMLGYLNPDYFAGGTISVLRDRAETTLRALEAHAGVDWLRIAWGVHDIVNENMANAARVHIAEHGRDPRDYSLLATGGGGPLHGYYVAKKLGLRRLIVPPSAGVASALGLLIAPARVDRVTTLAMELSTLDWPMLEASYQQLNRDAVGVLAETGLDAERAIIHRAADIRYRGQAFELVVQLPAGPYTAQSHDELVAEFERSYIAAFARTPPASEVEIINVRVSATLESPDQLSSSGSAADRVDGVPESTRMAYFPELSSFVDTPVFARSRLAGGHSSTGPAIIEEPESTLIVGPNGRFSVAPSGNIIVEI